MRLSLTGVGFRYHGAERDVLEDITCTFPAGSTTAVVGPSGSGKTTLLALLGGLLPPQRGTFAALDAEGRSHHPREVSCWVLQSVNLLMERSVLDNVCLGAYMDGLDERAARERAQRSLTQMGLVGFESRPARVLSGGEAQRVGIARALASIRPILFADEPSGQLDAATTEDVMTAMFASAERTIVLVTHDELVAKRCDRMLRLEQGVLVGDDRD